MNKVILVTGATDGIGRETAKLLVAGGHEVLLHGRNPTKLQSALRELGAARGYLADLSRIADVDRFALAVSANHPRLDVLINNAGILKSSQPKTDDGLDVRFVVNTFAPYLLAQRLLPLIPADGRIVNVSSAAQESVSLTAMAGEDELAEVSAYAQSKLALTMFSRLMAAEVAPVVVSVNPGSLLATKMAKEAFGQSRGGVEVGAQIIRRAALAPEFADATGRYFDNDSGDFGPPHPDALDDAKASAVVAAIRRHVSL